MAVSGLSPEKQVKNALDSTTPSGRDHTVVLSLKVGAWWAVSARRLGDL